jgi:uncharacterized membrane protein
MATDDAHGLVLRGDIDGRDKRGAFVLVGDVDRSTVPVDEHDACGPGGSHGDGEQLGGTRGSVFHGARWRDHVGLRYGGAAGRRGHLVRLGRAAPVIVFDRGRSRFGPDTPLGFRAEEQTRRYQRLRRVLRRRRRLRVGLVQFIFIAFGVVLALLMPEIDVGADVDSNRVSNLMFSLSGGVVAVIAVVFSLLFLVVPYANTNLTPRLTLFREDPVVWRSFAFFVAVFVYCATAGMALSNDEEISFLVPVIALLLVLVALGAIRTLQFRAYRSLQLGATLSDITAQGQRVIDVLYADVAVEADERQVELPPVEAEVRWPHGLGVLAQVDVPKLVRLAAAADALVELKVRVGGELRRGIVVVSIRRGAERIDHARLLKLLDVAGDRTFDQDPLFAFRLLVDIALRAVSAAINDPITAVQAIGGVHELLHTLVGRDLDIGLIGSTDGELRVVLNVPRWEDYLAVGVDELSPYVGHNPQAQQRLVAMVDALLIEAPPCRRASLEARQQALAGGG